MTSTATQPVEIGGEGKPRVLLAEDDLDTRKMLMYVLYFAGYEVIELADGRELLDYLASCLRGERDEPDLVVADIRMPYASGLDVLREINESGMRTPVVLISAYCDRTNRELAREGGAILLEKPLAADTLLMTLAAIRGS